MKLIVKSKLWLLEIKNIILLTLLCSFLLFAGCVMSRPDKMVIMRALESFILPFSGCWVAQGLYSFVREETRELFLSFPVPRKYNGLVRILLYYVVFSILVLAFMFFSPNINNLLVADWLVLLSEISFWMSLGFLITITTHQIIASYAAIWAYAAAQILDSEKHFKALSILYYPEDSGTLVIHKYGCVIIISILLILFTQSRFEKMEL